MHRSLVGGLDYAFGRAMLTLRDAIGLTQEGLAARLGVSRRSIGAWEGGRKYPKPGHLKAFIALAVEQRAFSAGRETEEIRALWRAARQRVLLDEAWLGQLLAPGPARACDAPVSGSDEAGRFPVPGASRRTSSLPFQPTPLVGREAELAEIARTLADPACRLLTLVGPGGVGKTRLALEVAARRADAYADGVAFMALASIGDPGQIVSAIGDALNLSFASQSTPAAQLLGYLRERQMLLVLDNFEHLLAGADVVDDVLVHAPRVTLLVTSRERLSLRAEWLFDVGGLAYPPDDERPNGAPRERAALTDYGAVQLFLQRASQVQPAFSPTASTIAAIARICQHLAGLPLAIELAAAGTRTLPVGAIERQLRASLDGLTSPFRDLPARHRSLRAAFDHSWDLLSEPERALFGRLAVFRGDFTVEVTERVAGGTLRTLAALVEKSLVRQGGDHVGSAPERAGLSAEVEPRFVMLEPIREYAWEKLLERREAANVQRAHAIYYLALAEEASARWESPGAEATIARLDRDHDNLRAALRWARDDGDLTIGLRLGAALRKFWQRRGYFSEGRASLEALLAREDHAAGPEALTARRRAIRAAAWLAADTHDYARAAQLFDQSQAIPVLVQEVESAVGLQAPETGRARATGQYARAIALLEGEVERQAALGRRGPWSTSGLGMSLYGLALVLRERGEFGRATALYEQCLDLHCSLGNREGIAVSLLGLGDVARDQGNVAQVRAYCEPGLAIARDLGLQWAIGFLLNNLALADYLGGDLARALDLVDTSAALFRVGGADASLAEVLITRGHILRAMGDATEAASAMTEALRLARAVGPRLMVAMALEGLAVVLAQGSQAPRAVQLLAAASALRAEMGTPVRPVDRPVLEHALAMARSARGAASFAAAWKVGEDLSLEPTLDAVLEAARPPSARSSEGLDQVGEDTR